MEKPMDGISGIVNRLLFRDIKSNRIKSNKCIINSAKEFSEYAEESIQGINSFYFPVNNVIEEPQGIVRHQKYLKLENMQGKTIVIRK